MVNGKSRIVNRKAERCVGSTSYVLLKYQMLHPLSAVRVSDVAGIKITALRRYTGAVWFSTWEESSSAREGSFSAWGK